MPIRTLNRIASLSSTLLLVALLAGCGAATTQPAPAAAPTTSPSTSSASPIGAASPPAASPVSAASVAPAASPSVSAAASPSPAAAAASAVPSVAPSAVPTASGSTAPLNVVAAENFWGSIAAQLGGARVKETSVISDPNTDPHDYEPSPSDARTFAGAAFVIVNGVGYDPWAPQLLDANPVNGRVVLTVGDLVGVAEGGNPHRWYSPPDVRKVIDQITADYKQLDPPNAAYYDAQHDQYVNQGLATYMQLINDIKAKYASTPVGASESIFAPLSDALGLSLLTPASFLEAISEGTDPTASDLQTINQQIQTKQIKVYVYNSQNATPDVQTQVDAAKAQGIPVTTITETLTPPTATFQDWQSTQLKALQAALAQGTGH